MTPSLGIHVIHLDHHIGIQRLQILSSTSRNTSFSPFNLHLNEVQPNSALLQKISDRGHHKFRLAVFF